MRYTLECSREEDGRWLAEVPQLYDVIAYSDTEVGALTKAQALALRVLAEQLETGSCAPFDMSMSIVQVDNAEGADIVPSPPADEAAYDAWLTAEVQEALDDDSPTMSTGEVMRRVRASVFGK
jgi:predicted RNase H-like HicB family nuclease